MLETLVRSKGAEARAIDLEIEFWDKFVGLKADESFESIFEENIHCLLNNYTSMSIGISVMGYTQIPFVIKIVKHYLKFGSQIIIGGQFWNRDNATEFLSIFQSEAVTITIGDGASAIVRWVQNPDKIPPNSVRWVTNGVIHNNETIQNDDAPPAPDYVSVPWSSYERYTVDKWNSTSIARAAHLYVGDRRCPYKCNFCRVNSGSNIGFNSLKHIECSLQFMASQKVQEMNIMANEINPTRPYFLSFLDLMRNYNQTNKTTWFSYLRPQGFSARDADNMYSAGCRMLRYGVESGSQNMLNRMEKSTNVNQIEESLRYSSEAGIFNHVNFMIGYPGESEQDFNETLGFVKRNKKHIHTVRVNPFYLSPGSILSKDPSKYGIELLDLENGHHRYRYSDGREENVNTIKTRIQTLISLLLDEGIGFAGVLPFETLHFLSTSSGIAETLTTMRNKFPYLWSFASTEEMKAAFGGYKTMDKWEKMICQRGSNYSLNIATT